MDKEHVVEESGKQEHMPVKKSTFHGPAMEDATAHLLPFTGIPMLAPVAEENNAQTPARPSKCPLNHRERSEEPRKLWCHGCMNLHQYIVHL